MRTLTAVAAALAVSACSSNPAPLSAQQPPADPPPRTVEVSATASVDRTPDVATIHLAVETLADDARSATEQNAAAMDAVLRAVRELGIPPSRVRTQRIELQPRYDRPREGRPREVTGYSAVNQVQVRVDDLDRLGAVVDAAVRAGANRVTGIRFELSDPTEAHHEALRSAIAQARAEAEVAAAALGEELGPPLQVSTGGDRPVPYMAGRGMAMMEVADGPPVEPGEIQIRATVRIVWRLGP